MPASPSHVLARHGLRRSRRACYRLNNFVCSTSCEGGQPQSSQTASTCCAPAPVEPAVSALAACVRSIRRAPCLGKKRHMSVVMGRSTRRQHPFPPNKKRKSATRAHHESTILCFAVDAPQPALFRSTGSRPHNMFASSAIGSTARLSSPARTCRAAEQVGHRTARSTREHRRAGNGRPLTFEEFEEHYGLREVEKDGIEGRGVRGKNYTHKKKLAARGIPVARFSTHIAVASVGA